MKRMVSYATTALVIWGTAATAEHAPLLSDYHPLSVERQSSFGQSTTELAVRASLRMLPYYGVFDHLAYRVDGDVVTLFGEVLRPELIHDAQHVVKEIDGVYHVHNMIRLLTDSPAENEVRKRVFMSIYGDSRFSPYTLVSGGGIHIVVEGNRVTLDGEVSSDSDRRLLALRVSGLQGVFHVVDHLTVCH